MLLKFLLKRVEKEEEMKKITEKTDWREGLSDDEIRKIEAVEDAVTTLKNRKDSTFSFLFSAQIHEQIRINLEFLEQLQEEFEKNPSVLGKISSIRAILFSEANETF